MEDIYVGGNNSRRDRETKDSSQVPQDIYITPRTTPEDIYIGKRRAQPVEFEDVEADSPYDYDDDGADYSYEPEEPEEAEKKPKKKKKHGRLYRRLRAAVLVAVVFFGIVTGLIYHTFSSVNYTETGHKKNVFLDSSELMQSVSVKNILLIGVDRRSADDASRSDTMLMVSINTATQKIKLTSFMRDSYVYVPEKMRNAKLNAA